MRRLFILCLLIPSFMFAQKDQAKEQIKELKDGVLLVRLMTSEKKVKALMDAGYPEKAKEAEEEQEMINKGIVESFEEEFDFCRVLYFNTNSTEKVKQKQFEGTLMDKDMQYIENIDPPITSFFIAEFGTLEQTDEKYRDDDALRSNEEGKKEAQTSYYGSPDMGLPALLIRDSSFVQLRNPFPYYVRTYESLSVVQRKTAKTVTKLNGNLHDFYSIYYN